MAKGNKRKKTAKAESEGQASKKPKTAPTPELGFDEDEDKLVLNSSDVNQVNPQNPEQDNFREDGEGFETVSASEHREDGVTVNTILNTNTELEIQAFQNMLIPDVGVDDIVFNGHELWEYLVDGNTEVYVLNCRSGWPSIRYDTEPHHPTVFQESHTRFDEDTDDSVNRYVLDNKFAFECEVQELPYAMPDDTEAEDDSEAEIEKFVIPFYLEDDDEEEDEKVERNEDEDEDDEDESEDEDREDDDHENNDELDEDEEDEPQPSTSTAALVEQSTDETEDTLDMEFRTIRVDKNDLIWNSFRYAVVTERGTTCLVIGGDVETEDSIHLHRFIVYFLLPDDVLPRDVSVDNTNEERHANFTFFTAKR